jgi:hypothetical protein
MTFSFYVGILSATVIAIESTQNSLKLPNFVKICPKTISLRNFEIPPKIEILIFFQKNKILYVDDAPKHVLTIWISNTAIFCIPFYCQKTAFVCEFQHTPLWKIIFFSMFHTSCGYEIL